MQACPWFITSRGHTIGWADWRENLIANIDEITFTSQPWSWGIATCHACARRAASVGDLLVLVSSAMAARDEGSLQPNLPPQVFSQPKIVLWKIMATDHESHCLHRKISFRSNALFDPQWFPNHFGILYRLFFNRCAYCPHVFGASQAYLRPPRFFTQKYTRKHAAKNTVTWSECCASLEWQARSNITRDLGALAPGGGLGRVFLILLASSVANVASKSKAPNQPFIRSMFILPFPGTKAPATPRPDLPENWIFGCHILWWTRTSFQTTVPRKHRHRFLWFWLSSGCQLVRSWNNWSRPWFFVCHDFVLAEAFMATRDIRAYAQKSWHSVLSCIQNSTPLEGSSEQNPGVPDCRALVAALKGAKEAEVKENDLALAAAEAMELDPPAMPG